MNSATPGRFVVPEVVSTHFNIKPGDMVADFGAGSGFYLKILSEKVENGKVYGCEIQKQLVDKLSEYITLNNLTNVYPLWCDLEEENGVKLADGALDTGILVNTLFQFEQKESAITEIKRVLRSGGLLYVVDWTESFGGLGPQPDNVFTKEKVIALLESKGFLLESEFPAGDHHYGVTFRKL